MKNKLWLVSVFLFGLTLLGCQTTTTYYQGAKADEEGVVTLSMGEVEKQHWQDLYVTVDYSSKREGNRLGIKGIVSFSESPKINFEIVRDVKFKLFLLDKDLRVVDYLDIARTLGSSLEDQLHFNKTIKLTDNIVAFTFGYEGSFIDDEWNSFSVWKLPKRKF
ncbi:MAG: hypothetical protein QNK27_05300 [Desulfuromusa sp.]|nr:hypothetical protein [Desulfuromusa sp.]